ncbi:Uncharacterized protein APZ42_002024 [Daphnia magna]|uniref:Uncharacterized protein n=1 Tax=Daphnia magna TaxID=35525 RepID=A0A0P4XKK5_9CRUS|nr:Uncharacterized protein APZ42_002024 [Daphnia magna]
MAARLGYLYQHCVVQDRRAEILNIFHWNVFSGIGVFTMLTVCKAADSDHT